MSRYHSATRDPGEGIEEGQHLGQHCFHVFVQMTHDGHYPVGDLRPREREMMLFAQGDCDTLIGNIVALPVRRGDDYFYFYKSSFASYAEAMAFYLKFS